MAGKSRSEDARAHRLRELAWLFLKLGTSAFGGPAVHIAMMEQEVVRRRRWLSPARFLDLLGATNLIPGPNSTEMAIHIGQLRAGWPGLLVAGASFILPATVIVTFAAWAYVRFGALPAVQDLLYGVKPVVIAIVVRALWGLGRTALRGRLLAGIAVTALAASLAGVNELLVLFAAGLAAVFAHGLTRRTPASAVVVGLPFLGQLGTAPPIAAAMPFALWPLFLLFLKIGAVLFGSGYVLFAFLHADLVERLHWLSETQLLDAIAVGQVTPGPVFTTATFIGYLLGGPRAALVATFGIFLPAFIFVALSGPLVPRLRRSPGAGAFLDGVNVGALALMTAVTWRLAQSAVVDLPTAALALLSALALLRFRLNSMWLVLGAGLLGAGIQSLR